MTDLQNLLVLLKRHNVEFILVGGVAAIAHGASRLTQDLDVVYRRTPDNLERIVQTLAPHEPYLRGVPVGLPFRWDNQTLKRGLNFTLTTNLGDLDLLGEIAGGGTYEELLPFAIELTIYGQSCYCLGLEKLIEVKRAAGRAKDFDAIAELEAILEDE